MRTISKASTFKRDLKKLTHNARYKGFETVLVSVIDDLLAERPLPTRLKDHALRGVYTGCRECHLHPDLLLIYRDDSLGGITLMRLGTHSEVL